MTSTKVRSNSVRGKNIKIQTNQLKKKDLSYVLWSPGEKKQTLRNSREHHWTLFDEWTICPLPHIISEMSVLIIIFLKELGNDTSQAMFIRVEYRLVQLAKRARTETTGRIYIYCHLHGIFVLEYTARHMGSRVQYLEK